MDNSNKPDLRAYIGATGSGKGVSIREHLKASNDKRRVFWDPLGEYGQFGKTVTTIKALCEALKAETFAVCFWPGANAQDFAPKFDLFCRAVFSAGRCFVHIEELADVTTPATHPQPGGASANRAAIKGCACAWARSGLRTATRLF